MKKTLVSLALVLVMLVCAVCAAVPASAARIAPYLSQYEEVVKPSNDVKWLIPNNSIAIWWGQDTIVGEWTPPLEYTDANRYWDGSGSICWMDNDKKTALLRYGLPTTAKELVFADAFTAYGAGDYGYSKMQPSDWERFTLAGSMDGQNWFAIEFTVKYHLEPGSMYYGTHVSSLEEPTDLWWHLVFTEEVEFEYLAFHTSNEASQDDASYELCFPMDHNYIFVVSEYTPSAADAATTEAPTEAPTTAAPTEAPETNAATTEGSTEAPTAATTEAPTAEPAGESGGLDAWVYAVIAVAAVAVIVIVVVIVKKRK